MGLKKRVLGLSLALICLATLGFGAIKVAWQDGAPLWWVLRGRHFQRVVIHWENQKLDSRDPQLIARFDNAIRPAFASVNYPMNELADDPENWNVILFDQRNQPFEVQPEVYDGRGFYAPSVGSTYASHPDIKAICDSVLGSPKKISR